MTERSILFLLYIAHSVNVKEVLWQLLSERLLLLREEKHVSQAVAANASGINLRTYHRYENGEREASVSTLIRMADYFGVTIDYLVGRSDAR
mgnify:CR=1 FL=1